MTHDSSPSFDEMDLGSRVSSFAKREDITSLLSPGSIGVELGVAEGSFSARLLKSPALTHLYSIDMWAGDGGHTVEQYKKALRKLLPHRERNSVLRMRFDEALDLFPDEFFDFIYVDGYAHTGEEDGQTFRDWFPKLKKGGIFSGDDYHPEWPLVVKEIDKFVAEKKLDLFVTNFPSEEDSFSRFPTWVVRKN